MGLALRPVAAGRNLGARTGIEADRLEPPQGGLFDNRFLHVTASVIAAKRVKNCVSSTVQARSAWLGPRFKYFIASETSLGIILERAHRLHAPASDQRRWH